MALSPNIPPDARRFQRYRSRYALGDAIDLIEWNGQWFEEVPESWNVIPAPGIRPMKVKEMVAGRFRKTRRYGEWIEIERETASSHEDLLRWCRRHCNSETPSGTLRFSPKVWEERSEDPLAHPFVPEFDHPDPAIRELAAADRVRRAAELDLQDAQRRRDQLVLEASEEGHSRREVAEVLGLSFGRVQQLVQGRR